MARNSESALCADTPTSEELEAMLDWLNKASDKEIRRQMKLVEKEYFRPDTEVEING